MQQKVSGRIAVIISFLSLVLLSTFSVFTADDAYILFRYVENFLGHGELSFNIGERINALTSPLHAFITIVLSFISGSYLLHTSKLLMCILLFVSVFWVAKPYKDYPLLFILPFVALLLSPFILMWTVGGLETVLLIFLVTCICIESLKQASPKQLYKLSIIAGLAFITRFDSVLFTAPFLVIYFYLRFSILKHFCILFRAVLLFALLPAGWLSFALFYFHDPLPTSFYLKFARTFSFDTVIYCLRFFLYMGFIPFYALGIFLLYRSKNLHYFKVHFYKYAHIHIALLVITIYGFANAQTHMMFGHRLLLPYSAALLLIVLDLLRENFGKAQTKAFSGKGIYVVFVSLFAGFQLFHCGYVYFRSVNGITNTGEYKDLGIYSYKYDFLNIMEAGARDLQKHINSQNKFKTQSPTFTTFAEGVIPYNIPHLYTYGPLISLRKNDIDFDYYVNHTDYFYLVTHLQQDFLDGILQHPELYKLVSKRKTPFDGELVTFYIFYNPNSQPLKLTKFIRDKPSHFFIHALNKLSRNNAANAQ